MVRYTLDAQFRKHLFALAQRKISDDALGVLLGYHINQGYRARQMKTGNVSLSREQVETLAKASGVAVMEILNHSREIYVGGPYANGRGKG